CTEHTKALTPKVYNPCLKLENNLKQTRLDTLSYVLFGKNEEILNPTGIGPHRIIKASLSPLETEKSILDVKCGTGDNLVLMHEVGFTSLTGIDINLQNIQTAKTRGKAEVLSTDIFGIKETASYNLVFAEGFVDSLPKDKVRDVMERLLKIAQQRFFFSATIPEVGEIVEKSDSDEMKCRNRHTTQEILSIAKDILATDSSLSFHYFHTQDSTGTLRFNGIFERHDIKKIYAEDGVLLYRELHDPKKIENLQIELEQMKDLVPKPGSIMRYDAKEVFDRVENFLPYCSDNLRTCFTTDRVMNIISTLLGEDAILLKDKINYKLPGSNKYIAHQDVGAGWDKYGDHHLTFALSMDEATEQSGALFFAVGEHKKGLLSPMNTPLGDEVIKSLKWSIADTKPGDALFFDSYLPHYSEANKSLQARKMSFLTYIPKRSGDLRESFFIDKRKRQPTIDERSQNQTFSRDPFEKLVTTTTTTTTTK
ncbi:MAG TPA: phytanoyl-CoA dioxygenase family protein, partial [Parachlamydiaceae bacterium]|nr:phytanoyl-CoA dioxygenase family protein [Parachlamydiaceae bacterium]